MAGKIGIIGAGVAGLSAGCYLQINGFTTEIFEMHTLPGGLCTGWERQGYTFNGCLHWLVGSSPAAPFHEYWKEVLDLDQLQFVHHDVFFRIEDTDGALLNIYTDIDRLQAELLAKAPEDEREIRILTREVRKLLRFKHGLGKAPELQSILDRLLFLVRVLPCLGTLRKYVKLTHNDYSKRFKNPLLSRAIRELFVPDMSMIFSLFSLAWMHQRGAGYPLGGSRRFSRLLEERYLGLGGKIHYGSKVTRIITHEKRAAGIVLEGGVRHDADTVISAADGHDTLWNLLGGQYTDRTVATVYETHDTFPSIVQVSFGVRKRFEPTGGSVRLLLDTPLRLDPATSTDLLSFTIYSFDPTLAPAGGTSVTAMTTTPNYRYWQDLRAKDPQRYAAEKDRIGQAVIDAFEKRFGEVRSCLEAMDVTTPATYIRYTNNWKGSFEGWLLNPRMGYRQLSKTLSGLAGFYMIGHWVQPGGGVPGALLSARNVAQLICRQEHRKFRTRN